MYNKYTILTPFCFRMPPLSLSALALDIKAIAPPKNLHAPVYERIHEMILDGRLLPGDRIDEEAFSKALRVSRTPLREALHRLDQEGLASIQPRRGAFVADFTKAQILDLLELRETLEGFAARLASERGDQAALARLREFAQTADIVDARELIHADRMFHQSVYEATGNLMLIETSRRINDQVQLVRLTTTLLGDRRIKSTDEIAGIVNAIGDRDADRAERLAREHVRAAIAVVRTSFPDDATLSNVAHQMATLEGASQA